MVQKRIRLFWWNEKYFHKKSKENYGDLLGKYLVEKISSKKVIFSLPKKFSILDLFFPIYVTIGSILSNVNHKCIVWGSGIISKNQVVKKAKFLSVRGPQTRKRLLELGYQVPEVYGDPALLLPLYYNPKVEKKYSYGIVPHYADYKLVKDWFSGRKDILIIDMMTNDIESKTNDFLSCEKIISSSLHGVIVSHAYQIPAVWVEFSKKLFGDGIKFQDYFESVNILPYQPELKEMEFDDEFVKELFINYPSLPFPQTIKEIQQGLINSCPF